MAPRKRTTKKQHKQDDHTFDLAQQIAELRGVVVKGFEGIHQRQDITNGRIGKLESRVDMLETENATSKGRRQGTWRFWLVLSVVLGLIIGLLRIVAMTGCWGLFCK